MGSIHVCTEICSGPLHGACAFAGWYKFRTPARFVQSGRMSCVRQRVILDFLCNSCCASEHQERRPLECACGLFPLSVQIQLPSACIISASLRLRGNDRCALAKPGMFRSNVFLQVISASLLLAAITAAPRHSSRASSRLCPRLALFPLRCGFFRSAAASRQ